MWCPEPESNRYAGFTHARDFKSLVSTNFTTRARIVILRMLEAGVGIEPAYTALQAIINTIETMGYAT